MGQAPPAPKLFLSTFPNFTLSLSLFLRFSPGYLIDVMSCLLVPCPLRYARNSRTLLPSRIRTTTPPDVKSLVPQTFLSGENAKKSAYLRYTLVKRIQPLRKMHQTLVRFDALLHCARSLLACPVHSALLWRVSCFFFLLCFISCFAWPFFSPAAGASFFSHGSFQTLKDDSRQLGKGKAHLRCHPGDCAATYVFYYTFFPPCIVTCTTRDFWRAWIPARKKAVLSVVKHCLAPCHFFLVIYSSYFQLCAHTQLSWGANPFHEQKIPSNTNNAILSWVTSKQSPEPSRTRNQVFVIRCHQYGCYNNAM